MNMSQCFPEPYKRSGGNVKAELGLCHYVTKADMIGATGIDTSKLASKTNLDILKTKVKDLDVDKLKNVPANLSKLSTVVDNGIVKKSVYDKLVTKVNAIDAKIPSTSEIVTKRQCDSKKQGLEKEIEDFCKKISSTSIFVKENGTT